MDDSDHLPRRLEPEVMDTQQEAIDYDSMDHLVVNRVFVDDLLAAWDPSTMHTAQVLDVGTGTAQIPIELCKRPLSVHITAIDLAEHMLTLGLKNIQRAELGDRITLECVDAKNLPYADAAFDAVISNSIIHHIPQPQIALAEMVRVLRKGGLLFIRDLSRPSDAPSVGHLVQTYAGESNEHQQKLFRDSLHAALTLDEVQLLLEKQGLPATWAAQTSDRHWTISGCL